MRTVDERSPTATGALEVKTLHKYEAHRLCGMPGDGTGILREHLAPRDCTRCRCIENGALFLKFPVSS